MEFSHIPVMPEEVIKYLQPRPGGVYIDCTLGGGGHASLVAAKINRGKLIGIDQDQDALDAARENLKEFSNVVFIQDNFRNLESILKNLQINSVDGILIDLGVSSYQLEESSRGFSFQLDENSPDIPLDMRMNREQNFSAYDVVNKFTEKELRDILYKLGEEPYAAKIARKIVSARSESPIKTTNELLTIIKTALPPKYRFGRQHGHWASKVFRAIRMEVNEELPVIEEVIPQAIECLNKGGRLVIITFHSLEDRIVKHMFRSYASGESPEVELITKKPILPSDLEITSNPKSSSAKMRVIEKI